ncbi:45246_t:CDS:2 [Gigaspora margarita]|uniref:45246_t:CDS:1 n=2 Tax=Gigaspora margarita TaxID=4874 RepID=A0ABN7VW20_GIGMA|nr:U2 small nuclear ribonucleoprotein B [Gigaspora margarita]CAG8802964.1 45246_t:CDS:2 [Gigaspora margarita]
MSSILPNQTLYIRNLNEKINKDELKRSLYALFSAYGRILDIVALKTIKMRGQAFIVFKEIQSATAAMRGLNGFNFYDVPMQIEYAKGKSDAVAKLDGTWKRPGTVSANAQRTSTLGQSVTSAPAVKRQREEEGLVDHKRPANGEKGRDMELETPEIEMDENDVPMVPTAPKGEVEPQNRILYIQNLPPDVTDEMLSYLFEQYPGFKEVRLVPGKSDIAFVEYEADHQAAVAKEVLNGFKITHEKEMKVTFAKR